MNRAISNSKRIDYIDVAKALGIIAVMVSHGCGFPLGTSYYFTASYMPLFFFLSGFTYRCGKKPYDNIKKRFIVIGKAYLFYNIILFIGTLLSYIILGKSISKNFIFASIGGALYSSNNLFYPRTIKPNISFFVIHNSALWYLTCFLIACIIFYTIIDRLKDFRKIIIAMLVLLLATFLMSYLPIRLP